MNKPVKGTVITDASFCHYTNSGGYGVWITMDSGNIQPVRIQKGGRLKGSPINCAQAELYAALNGIHIAVGQGCTDILLQTDNMEIVRTLSGHHTQFSTEYATALKTYFRNTKISARHVKGHSKVKDARSWCNRWCDAMARKHMVSLRKERMRNNRIILLKGAN